MPVGGPVHPGGVVVESWTNASTAAALREAPVTAIVSGQGKEVRLARDGALAVGAERHAFVDPSSRDHELARGVIGRVAVVRVVECRAIVIEAMDRGAGAIARRIGHAGVERDVFEQPAGSGLVQYRDIARLAGEEVRVRTGRV